MNFLENISFFLYTSIGKYKFYSFFFILTGFILWLNNTHIIYFFPFLMFGLLILFNFLFIHIFIIKEDIIWVAKYLFFVQLNINNIEKVVHVFPRTEYNIHLKNRDKLVIDPYFLDQKEVMEYLLSKLKDGREH